MPKSILGYGLFYDLPGKDAYGKPVIRNVRFQPALTFSHLRDVHTDRETYAATPEYAETLAQNHAKRVNRLSPMPKRLRIPKGPRVYVRPLTGWGLEETARTQDESGVSEVA